jgi:hypothetical protein
MKIHDTLFALLYLGKVSRDAVNYSDTPKGKEPDHSWYTFKKMDLAFRAKHPDLVTELNMFMGARKKYWGDLFSEQFKLHALSTFVSKNVNL